MVAPVHWYLPAWMKTTNLLPIVTKVCQLIGDLMYFVTVLEELLGSNFVLLLSTSVSLLSCYSI